MFDPNIPANNSPNSSAQMRGQLTSLKALIDAVQSIVAAQVDGVNTLPPGSAANATVGLAGGTLHFTFEIPRGDEGLPGAQGPPFAQAVVDAVNTLNPGDPAAVSVSFDGTDVHFTFGIPRGDTGGQGPAGIDGQPGATGGTGPQGPPFAQAVVDAVNTLNPGDSATVSASFDGTNVRFTFGIPRGNDGAQGAPGEVTNAQLTTAISGTSSNSNAVTTMDMPFTNDPPSLADLELMRAKYNELVLALRR